jgi:hypothetical protein
MLTRLTLTLLLLAGRHRRNAERFSLARPSPTTPGALPAAGPSLTLITKPAGRDPRSCAELSAVGDPAGGVGTRIR